MKDTQPKILQFGGGNFLRAFLGPAVTALNEEAGFAGSVIVVKPTEEGDYTALRDQNGRYHVFVRGLHGGKTVDEVQPIEVVSDVIHPYCNWQAFLLSAALPQLRTVVSNTTESGIRFVAEAWEDERCPAEFPAKLCRWLHARWEKLGDDTYGGVDVLPCELIENNGARLRECVENYADHWQLPPDFRRWLTDSCTFADTLVDRIVSGKPKADDPLWQRLGFPDEIPTVAEPYLLWAIRETPGLRQRFPLDRTGLNAVFTDDLAKYRTLKVRLLNGAHMLMVATGLPAGITTVGEYLQHPEWGPWLEQTLRDEVFPTLDYEGAEKEAYLASVLDRFRNPFLRHKLSDIALNKEDKWRVRIRPSIEIFRNRFGREPLGLVLAEGQLGTAR